MVASYGWAIIAMNDTAIEELLRFTPAALAFDAHDLLWDVMTWNGDPDALLEHLEQAAWDIAGFIPFIKTFDKINDARKVAQGVRSGYRYGPNTVGAAQRPLLGANGVQVTSKTVWKGKNGLRIDVENPNPGQRAGQIHLQDSKGNKYIFDPDTGTFPGAPKWVNDLMIDADFVKGLNKGLEKYLGEPGF
jgi:hypothetical protein